MSAGNPDQKVYVYAVFSSLKFAIHSKFATAIVKHYGGHFETTIFKEKLSSKSLQIVKNYGSSKKTLRN